MKNRIIIHVDINSCFASCEQQDNPKWRNKPLGVVQGSGRSIIIASSIEAKKLGINTGCTTWQAKKIYPNIILTPANFNRYVHYARLFRKICFNFSDQVEVFSIDELFIDTTHTGHLFTTKTSSKSPLTGTLNIVSRLKRNLKTKVGDYLTCSIGIAPNKMLAKLASGSQKPNGLVIVTPQKKLQFLDQFKLWHICGIGHKIEKRLNRMGIYTIKQMRQTPSIYLEKEFGIMGKVYSNWANGNDHSQVAPANIVPPDKSYGNQITLPTNTKNQKQTFKAILWLCWQVANRLRSHRLAAKTVSLYIKNKNSSAYSQKSTSPCITAYDLYQTTKYIYHHKLKWSDPIKFAGVSATNLTPLSSTTLPLFPTTQKQLKLSSAWDKIANRYGSFHLRPASLTNKSFKKTIYNGFTKKF